MHKVAKEGSVQLPYTLANLCAAQRQCRQSNSIQKKTSIKDQTIRSGSLYYLPPSDGGGTGIMLSNIVHGQNKLKTIKK